MPVPKTYRWLLCLLMALLLVIGFVPVATTGGMSAAPAYAEEGSGADAGDEQQAADVEAARVVDELIAALPQVVTTADRAAIEYAQAAYDALTPSQQALVQLKVNLDAAQAALQQAQYEEQEQRDAAAASAVDDLIAALPLPQNITRDDEAQVNAAVDAFNALTAYQQALVTRKADLDAAYAALQSAMEAPEEDYVETLMLKWDKPDDAGETHFVGDSATERSYRQIQIVEFGESVQLRGWYLSTDGTGRTYQTANPDTPLGEFSLAWVSSDPSVAVVDPNGLVSPRGKNGSVTITATVADPNVYVGVAPSTSVTISFDGQDGKYVTKVEILDEEGNAIGASWGGVTVYNDMNSFHQLQARITWHNVIDGSESQTVTGAGESYDAAAAGTTLHWNVSSSVAFTVNENTGRLKTGQYSGSAFVTCTALGGLGGTEVTDTANVQLDTGTYEYHPADSLTLKVVWEERPDEVVSQQTFSLDDLASRLPEQHVNATVVNHNKFGAISADGYLFKDIVALVNVHDDDVLQYRFGTADGYDNPVSYQYLFESGNRYYLPNYEVGRVGTTDDEIVPPLLAIRSVLVWNKSEVDPNWTLDEGTRFRLVFGCLSANDANTPFQIFYIHTITIVLKGAPAAGNDTNPNIRPTPTPDPGSGSPQEPPADPQGGGPGGGSGGGGGGTASVGGGTAGAGGIYGSPFVGPDNGTSGSRNASAQQAAEQGAGEANSESAAQSSILANDPGASKRWRVYQMMNKNNSDVPDWDDENPLSPFAAPLAMGVFAIGAGATGIGFRRRLR